MIYPANKHQISLYRNDVTSVNQSALKALLVDMGAFNHQKEELYFEEKTHFTIGTGVDDLLCFGQEVFDINTYVSSIPKPTGKTASIVKYVYDKVNLPSDEAVVTLSNHETEVLDGCTIEDFQSSWGNSAKLNKIVLGGDPYFMDLVRSTGKQIIDSDEKAIIDRIVDSFRTSLNTAIYFDYDFSNPHVDIYYQVPVYAFINSVMVKILLDIIAVDHTNKIVRGLDIKTTGDYTTNFPTSARRFRYDIQAAFYSAVLDKAVHNNSGLPFDTTGYSMTEFAFLVESTKVQGNPLVFKCDKSFIEMGTRGRPAGHVTLHHGKGTEFMEYDTVPGYLQLLEKWSWHQEHGYGRDKDVSDGGGVFNLGWKGKYL